MPEAYPLVPPSATTAKTIQLRYEDQWPDLLAQLETDRRFGLADGFARQTVLSLLDDSSFVELGSLARREQQSYEGRDDEIDTPPPMIDVPGDALVAGWGTIAERQVFVIADDIGLGGPVRGSGAAAKANRVRELALRQAKPLIEVLAAARLAQDQFIGAEFGTFGYGVDFPYEFVSRTQIPRVSLVCGPLTSQAAFEAASAHLMILVGPEARIGLSARDDERGISDYMVDNTSEAIRLTREFLAYLPENCWSMPTRQHKPSPPEGQMVHSSSTDGARHAALSLCDRREFFELRKQTAAQLFTALARVDGRSVGIAAADRLTPDGCAKLARFVRTCDTFRLPVIYVVADMTLRSVGARGEALAARAAILNCKSPQIALGYEQAGDQLYAGALPFLGVLDRASTPGGNSAPGLSYSEARAHVVRALAGIGEQVSAPWQDSRVNRGRSRRRNPASG